jgi:hypothetical protein
MAMYLNTSASSVQPAQSTTSQKPEPHRTRRPVNQPPPSASPSPKSNDPPPPPNKLFPVNTKQFSQAENSIKLNARTFLFNKHNILNSIPFYFLLFFFFSFLPLLALNSI